MVEVNFRKIDLLVMDVDGVLTDGRITYSDAGAELKSFHVRDGAGMKYWKRSGRKLAIITGRGGPAVQRRADELDVDAMRMNAKDKLPALLEVLEELSIPADRTAVIGDDLTDLPMLRRCALSVAVADAVAEVRQAVDCVTDLPGGAGAVRETIEYILKEANAWAGIMARYKSGGRRTE